MKNRLPIFVAVLFCLAMPASQLHAQGADVPSSADSTGLQPVRQPSPQLLLINAVDALGQRKSIVAKLRYHAVLYGRDVIGSGDYLQGTTSSRLVRYALRMQAGSREVDFLEVNDGVYLWRRVQYEDEPDVERMDVERILAAEHQATGKSNPAALLALGGLGRLLSVLSRDFEFTKALPVARLGNVPVYGIVGRRRAASLAHYKVKSSSDLRPHIPDEVVLYLGCGDLFPYLVEFRRIDNGVGQGGAPESKLLLKLDLFEVKFDVPLDAAQFQFAAEHLHYVDATDRAIADLAELR